MLNVFFGFTLTLFVVVALFLILLVLIQKGRGGGLAGAFGGAGGQTAFGSKTGDVLTWATSIVFGVFLLLAIALNLEADSIEAARKVPVAQTVPAAPAPANPQSATAPSAADTTGTAPMPTALPAEAPSTPQTLVLPPQSTPTTKP
jgi:preprotein translocase subunit SecG